MSNGDFNPHSFGAASVGVVGIAVMSMMAGMQGAGRQIAEAIVERTDAERAAFIDQTIEDMIELHAELQKSLAESQAALAAAATMIELLQAELTEAQKQLVRRPA
jgi:hypothetical protein